MPSDFLVGSTFSGVGGFDLGLERAGMRVAWQAENDPWCRRVLAHHWPGVPCYEDVRLVAQSAESAQPGGPGALGAVERDGDALDARPGPAGRHVDLLCGGFPCQDVSVAGKRAGLAGDRSGLFHEFARIAESLRPPWVLLENVPGLLTSNGGRDFGVVLGALVDLGYGCAWRVLDSRYFGVPQRRRRVFVVGHLGGDGSSALRALCESCPGSAAPRSCSWSAPPIRPRAGAEGDRAERRYYIEDGRNQALKAGGAGGSPPRTDRLPLLVEQDLSPSLTAHHKRLTGRDEAMIVGPLGTPRGGGHGLSADAAGGGQLVAATLSSGSASERPPGRRAEDDVNLVGTVRTHPRPGSNSDGSIAYSVTPETGQGADLRASRIDTASGIDSTGLGASTDRGVRIASQHTVRRLTPRECERLQGFPDDWTLAPGAKRSESRRYGAMGNAVTVPVAEFVGRGIMQEAGR